MLVPISGTGTKQGFGFGSGDGTLGIASSNSVATTLSGVVQLSAAVAYKANSQVKYNTSC